MNRYLTILLALCLACLSACGSMRPDPNWIEDEIEAGSDRVLWEVTTIALERTGFPIGTGLEPGKMMAVSGWKNSLEPFRGKGFRERCEIRYESKPEARRYKVSVRVERDRNMDIIRPLDLTYAEWRADPDNTERARVVLRYVKALLGDPIKSAKTAKKPSA